MYKTRTKFVWHIYDADTEQHIGSRSFKSQAMAEAWMENASIDTLKEYQSDTDYFTCDLYKVTGKTLDYLTSHQAKVIRRTNPRNTDPAHGELAPKPTE